MALIVDAYNVLHQAHTQPVLPGAMTATDLCRMLEHSSWSAQRMVVVCDGSPKPTEGDYLGPVELIYSGAGRDADSVIIELIDAADGPRDLVVVSNDGRIRRAARRRRARAMSAERFLRLLVRRPAGPAQPSKPAPDSTSAGEWLDEFGLDADSVEQIEREVEEQTRPRLKPECDRPKPQPQPRRYHPNRNQKPDDQTSKKRSPAETDTDFWLREFGLEDDQNP